MPRTRRTARSSKAKTLKIETDPEDNKDLNNEEVIYDNWLAEAEARYRILERALTKKKKERLHEIDNFFGNLSSEMLNMKIADLAKMQLGDQAQDGNKENEMSVDAPTEEPNVVTEPDSIESAIDKALKDLHSGSEDVKGQVTKEPRKAKASSKRKKMNKKVLLETPCNLLMTDVWRNTPAITPQLQSRIGHATPLTSVRNASAADYHGMSYKIVAFNSRGSPVAPAEFDCPDMLSTFSKWTKEAEKTMEEKRLGN